MLTLVLFLKVKQKVTLLVLTLEIPQTPKLMVLEMSQEK